MQVSVPTSSNLHTVCGRQQSLPRVSMRSMSSLLRSFVQPLGRSARAAAGVSSIAAHGALAQVAEAPQPVASSLHSLEASATATK